LLSYLVERSVSGDIPKEFDIAVDVFGKDAGFRSTGDAQIRVHVYKLRARLEGYYAGAGKDDPFRIEIPKGTYEVRGSPNDPHAETIDEQPRHVSRRVATYAGAVLAGLLIVAVALVTLPLADRAAEDRHNAFLANPIWSGILEGDRPILIVVGDHFFFGRPGTHVRTRDVRINSKEELYGSSEYGPDTDLIFETLTYLPKSVVFGMQSLLPRVSASGKTVSMKLVSELTSEELRDYDIVYLGFIRAMGLFRSYFFSHSNFCAESLFLELTHSVTGQIYAQTGPVPQRNRDYGLFATFTGPAGNQILVFSGIGDVGVLAAARSLNTREGIRQVEQRIETDELDMSNGFEVLLEADGHSRTDLDFRIVDTYPLSDHSDACSSLPSFTSAD
jgi:hypothetical protein